jgi:hypothetical protein
MQGPFLLTLAIVKFNTEPEAGFARIYTDSGDQPPRVCLNATGHTKRNANWRS